MKIIWIVTSLALICAFPLYAQSSEPPLTIAVTRFEPPYIMQGTTNSLSGFDIRMIVSLCKLMNRNCQFQPMLFSQLINSVAEGHADIAIGAIAITAERAKWINFTNPYALSNARFLARASICPEPYKPGLLDNKTIGVEKGTVFSDVIANLPLKNPNLVSYKSINDALVALQEGKIDLALMDNPTALYWTANSADMLKVCGPAYQYGFGLGIAVNMQKLDLLQSLNNALAIYQKSEAYRDNYNKYLLQF